MLVIDKLYHSIENSGFLNMCKNGYIQTMEYYRAQNEIAIKPCKDMEKLTCVSLSEGSQSGKATCGRISNCTTLWKRPNYGDVKKICPCQG